jgi:hypothetical protein
MLEIARLFLEFLKVLVWPVVVLTILLVFKNEIVGILPRLRRAALPGGVSLEFDAELKEAKLASTVVLEAPPSEREKQSSAPEIPISLVNARLIERGLQPSPSGLDLDYYRSLSEKDPNLSLAGIRLELEIAARNLAKGFKVAVDSRASLGRLYATLRERGAITAAQAELAQRVIALCNAAVHGHLVSKDQALEVIRIAGVLIDQYVRWLSWGFDEAPKQPAG